MILIWEPDDGESRQWEIKPMQLMTPDAEAIESVGGNRWDNYDDFGRRFMTADRRAYRAALWVLRRREEPDLEFETLSVRADEIRLEWDEQETARLRQVMLADPDLTPEQRAELLDEIKEQARTDTGGDDPKASPADDAPTGSTSLPQA